MNQPTSNTQPSSQMNKSTAIAGIVFFVAFGITIYLCFAEAWPVSKLNDIQANLFDGSYYPKLTFMLTLFAVWVPMLCIQKLIQMMVKK